MEPDDALLGSEPDDYDFFASLVGLHAADDVPPWAPEVDSPLATDLSRDVSHSAAAPSLPLRAATAGSHATREEQYCSGADTEGSPSTDSAGVQAIVEVSDCAGPLWR